MKKFMKNEGFTLVELIVVIAILGILAAVAVPAYSGYITKANDASIITELDAIKTAAQAANATAGEIESILVDKEGDDVTIVAKTALAANFKTDFQTYYGGTVNMPGDSETDATKKRTATVNITAISKIDNSSYKANGAKWKNGAWAAK